MNFDTFCQANESILSDLFGTFQYFDSEFIKCLYADSYLFRMLENLIDSKNKCSRTLDSKQEKDFEKATDNLFSHDILCQQTPEKFEYKQSRPKYLFDKQKVIRNCKNWFSILYSCNSSLCDKLFPIIVFILGDSYNEILDEKKNSNFNLWLYDFIELNLRGNFQLLYLFSLLSGTTTKRESCIVRGTKALHSLKSTYKKILLAEETYKSTKLARGVWHTYSGGWKLPEYTNCAKPYINTVDYYAKNFFVLLTESKIEKRLRDHQSDRKKYEIYHDENYYPNNNPLMGENFITFLLFLRDLEGFDNFSWSNYSRPLTMYAINRMTQWVTPFTTRTIPYIMPVYNALIPLTCNYFNQNMMAKELTIQNPKCEYMDFGNIYDKTDNCNCSPESPKGRENPFETRTIDFLKKINKTQLLDIIKTFKNMDDITISDFLKYFGNRITNQKSKELSKQIIERCHSAMKLYGYSQEQLAERISVSKQFLSDAEKGIIGIPASTIIRLYDVLSILSDSFFLDPVDNAFLLEDIVYVDRAILAEDTILEPIIANYTHEGKNKIFLEDYVKHIKELDTEFIHSHQDIFKNRKVTSDFIEYLTERNARLKSVFYFYSNFVPIKKTSIFHPDDYDKLFDSWYSNSTDFEKASFHSFLESASNELFKRFINYKTETLFLPTSKHFDPENRLQEDFGYYYCLCDNFTMYFTKELNESP